jgi:hypothetical protein
MNGMPNSVEDRIVARLEQRFGALRDAGRCVFAREVRVLTWGHIAAGSKTVRADFVISLDDSPMLAVEVKGRFDQPVDLGKALSQCDDYARAQIGANDMARVPHAWVGRPIWGAVLAFDVAGSREAVQAHTLSAHRIMGPRNVGFLEREDRGLCIRLGGERYWSEWNGWRADAFARGVRIGSARTKAP